MAWQNFYKTPGNRYGITGPFYGPQGHRGQDFVGNDAGTATPAYEAGTVALVRFSAALGTVVVIKLSDGLFAGYAHQRADVPVKVGQKVKAGQTIGYIAGENDAHGTSWAGPHLHTTLGDTEGAVFYGVIHDPLPRVQKATIIKTVPAVVAAAPLGEEMPNKAGQTVRLNQKLKAGVFQYLHLNTKNFTTFATGAQVGAITGTINFHITGLPVGQVAQVRVVRVKTTPGLPEVLASLGLNEIVGTDGSTYGQYSFTDELRSGDNTDRLRVQIAVPVEGVVVSDWTYRFLFWK